MKIDPENISDFLNECEFAPFVFSYDSRGEIFRRNRSFDKLLDGSGLSNVSDILVNFRPFFSDDQYHGVISIQIPGRDVFSVKAIIKKNASNYTAVCGVDFNEQLDLQRKLFCTNQEISNLTRELYKKKQQLERLNEFKDEFISILSHDLRGPLRRINSFAQLLEISLEPEKDSECANYLGFIRKESMMMHQMVIDILNYEAIESGKFKLNLEYADLHSLINETLQVFNNSIAEKSITLKPSLQAALHHSNIDAVKMRQVIENLLINCIKYTPEGSDITVKTWNEQDRIFTLISDNGRGFSEKELGELFVPFKKGLAAGNVSDSFGLGMSIVKKIIESHGGTISAANAPGGGAQFTITLPGKTAEEQ